MAAITWGDVENHAAHLANPTVPTAAQTDILAHVNTALDVDRFGGEDADKTKLVRIYLAAHFGQSLVDAAAGVAGPVTSKELGDMKVGYGNLSAAIASSDYSTTGYGRSYLAIVRRTAACRAGFSI